MVLTRSSDDAGIRDRWPSGMQSWWHPRRRATGRHRPERVAERLRDVPRHL